MNDTRMSETADPRPIVPRTTDVADVVENSVKNIKERKGIVYMVERA